ncbi:homocysteine S-methyltransferase family protein [Thiohalorhabdus methylotrophus]|uniref:Homocysteine S-methyltransferase family protein n=1 Tax=Thiohalorhabdus methylotrophus TaxID=3242694 RepID=A0ABV4TS85_9GAMM
MEPQPEASSVRNRLEAGAALLLDGGMGQELIARGVDASTGLWSAQALFDHPDTVMAVHRAFIDAGADVVTTNTYATTRRRIPDCATFWHLNRKACELAVRAREDSGRPVAIAGSLAPLHGSYRPDLVRSADELAPQYAEQAEVLCGYVDLFLCETMSTATEAQAAARGAGSTGKPVWVSWTLADDGSGRLRSGETIAEAIAGLDGLDVEAVLVNCSIPESIAAAMPELANSAGRPFGGYANGFTPIRGGVDDGRALPDTRQDLDPEAYAGHARQWLSQGARIVGGCCEVGPAHIAELRRHLA